jgi:isoleucyl-tRNA synthetase
LRRQDRWILSRLQTLTEEVGRGLTGYDYTAAARALESFIEDELSNWFIRRNRARFWSAASAEDPDKLAAFAALYRCLRTTAQAMAPLAPFTAEALWQELRRGDEPDSVHLCDWPVPEPTLLQPQLEVDMQGVLRVVELGRQVRTEAGLKTRQPLARMWVGCENVAGRRWLADGDLVRQVLDELNVKQADVTAELGRYRKLRVRPNFPVLGKKVGKAMRTVQAIVESLPEQAIERVRGGGGIDIEADGQHLTLTAEDLVVDSQALPGFAVAASYGYTVVLDTELGHELIAEGLAIEVKSKIQNQRKDQGLQPADRVLVEVYGDAELVAASRTHATMIRRETLAVQLDARDSEPPSTAREWEINGRQAWILIAKAEA